MTVLSIDTGDLEVIKRFAATGLITDATTNPLFVSQTAARGSEPEYAALVDAAVAAAKRESGAAGEKGCDMTHVFVIIRPYADMPQVNE